MGIRSSFGGLRSVYGVDQAMPAATPVSSAVNDGSAMESDGATLSSAGGVISLMASGSDVRADKVARIQAALASGSYSVSAPVVASRVVNYMLGSRA